MRNATTILWIAMLLSCGRSQKNELHTLQPSPVDSIAKPKELNIDTSNALYIHTGNTTPEQIVSYAETLIGIPYKYASTDPAQGFDCSGFITYVFNHFDIVVPRSSVDFTNVPREISVSSAKPGDLILFTGTDRTIRVVGHMGIVVSNLKNQLYFIHSTSGKAWGVTISPLDNYYMGRFVKVIRVFPQND
jgi:cell wall-associated NlpC family hydrolase